MLQQHPFQGTAQAKQHNNKNQKETTTMLKQRVPPRHCARLTIKVSAPALSAHRPVPSAFVLNQMK